MRGLDPRIHAGSQETKVVRQVREKRQGSMDCRVKPAMTI